MAETPSTKHCPMQGNCPLYPLFVLQSNLRLWQERYCESDYRVCARFQLGRKGAAVPPTLLPNGALLKKVGGP